MKVSELKSALKDANLNFNGKKADLVARLAQHLAAGNMAAAPEQEEEGRLLWTSPSGGGRWPSS